MNETDKKWVIPAINKPTNSDKFTCSNCVACECNGFCHSLAIWISFEEKHKGRHPDCPAIILNGIPDVAALVEEMNKRKGTDWACKNHDGNLNHELIRHNETINEMILLVRELAGGK